MLAVANNTALSPRWESAPISSDCSTSQLSGACALLAVLVHAQSTTQSAATTDIERGFAQLEELKKQLADSIQQAKDAADDAGFFGFLGDIFGSDIAQIAGAVAAVAATIATAGAASPLLLIAISEALQVAAKAGAELGLAPEICMALSIASVAVGFCSGVGAAQQTGKLADAARLISCGAKIIQGGATATGGALHYVAGHYQAKQLDAQADAAGYQAHDDATSLSLDDAFAQLQRALRNEDRETGTVSEILKNDAETNTSLCNRI
jgi:hypothetical protein